MWKYKVKKARFTYKKSGTEFTIGGYITDIRHNIYNPPFEYPMLSYTIVSSIYRRRFSIEPLDNLIYSISRWETHGTYDPGWHQIYCINDCSKVDI